MARASFRVEYYETADGWRWRLTARNGRIVCASSEAFATRSGARRNAGLTYVALAKLDERAEL